MPMVLERALRRRRELAASWRVFSFVVHHSHHIPAQQRKALLPCSSLSTKVVPGMSSLPPTAKAARDTGLSVPPVADHQGRAPCSACLHVSMRAFAASASHETQQLLNLHPYPDLSRLLIGCRAVSRELLDLVDGGHLIHESHTFCTANYFLWCHVQGSVC
jgi:hypothetical protein